jgi:pimeloyl-ACP methyl ester carboxylesterase
MSYDEMMADVLAWLNAQKIERATFVGHSMGGKVAMLLACRHPGRVDRLVVVDIAPKSYLWPAHRTNFAAMLELNLADIRARGDAELRLEGRIPSLSMRKFLTTNLERKDDGTWFWQINLPVLAAALPALEKNPLAPSNRFEGETLFLVGAKSTYVMPEDHAAIRTHFPAAEIRVLPGAGHNPHTETRPQFVAAVFSR